MQRILASILSLLILLSSTGLTYAEHYCGEHKMMGELTLGHVSLSCGMVMPVTGCDSASVSMDCCDNEYLSIDLDDDFAKVAFDFDFSLDYVCVSPINQEVSVSLAPQQELVGLPFYRPPPDKQPLFILYESYLI